MGGGGVAGFVHSQTPLSEPASVFYIIGPHLNLIACGFNLANLIGHVFAAGLTSYTVQLKNYLSECHFNWQVAEIRR